MQRVPTTIYVLHVIGSILFLYGSVWNIVYHPEPNNIFYVYAAGSMCFLVAASWNLFRRVRYG